MKYQLYHNDSLSSHKWEDHGSSLVGTRDGDVIISEAYADEGGVMRFTLKNGSQSFSLFVYENKSSAVISDPATASAKEPAKTLETLQAFSRLTGLSPDWEKKVLSDSALKSVFKDGIVKRLVTSKGERIGQQLSPEDVQGQIKSISSYRPLPRALYTVVPSGQVDIAEARTSGPHEIFRRLVSSK